MRGYKFRALLPYEYGKLDSRVVDRTEKGSPRGNSVVQLVKDLQSFIQVIPH